MVISNSLYGGFIVSKNIIAGKSIKYSFREESSLKQLNGWTFLSVDDSQEYVNDSNNFVVLNAESIYEIAPVILELFNAPYGTDLCWLYEEDVLVGFYDLILEKETSIEEILRGNETL